MKTLFLLLIIYNLQYYVVRSHGTSTIIYKTFPKKVHPDPDHHELVNAGSYFKKSYKSKDFTRFQPPPVHQLASNPNNEKAVRARRILPLGFQGDIKSRVRKVSYFNDNNSKRSKRAVNESKPETTIKESSTLPSTQKTEAEKPKEDKQIASAKNASISRRVAPKNLKAPAKSSSKRQKPQKVEKLSDAKAIRTRNEKQGPKKINPKRGLRKRKLRSRISKAGKRHAQNAKGIKQAGKVTARQASKQTVKQPVKQARKQPVKQASRQPVKQASKQPVKQASKQPVKQVSKQLVKQASKQPVKQASKPAGKKSGKPSARRGQTKASPKARRRASRRLISARDARPEDYPYVVSIQKDNEHWCSGAILNPQLIISTANCFWKSKAVSRMKIRAGAHSVDTGGQIAYIAEVRKHPNWSIRKDPSNDIALALLDRRLKFSDAIHAVDLPNIYMKPPFDDAWVTSYGSERRDGMFSRMRLTLQVLHMHLMDDEKCLNITARFNVYLDDSFFCLEQIGRRAPCTRDTGAPAVSDGVLWGLASWGIRKLCGTSRFPAMFSDVSAMSNMDFIINVTKSMMGEHRVNPFLDRRPTPVGEEAIRAGDTVLIEVPDMKPERM